MRLCTEPYRFRLSRLLARFGLRFELVPAGAKIPGSYWGAPEAGIVGHVVYARADTPVHSVLHEAGHIICMDAARRASLHTDAGGEFAEEDAVCYLQIALAMHAGLSVVSICADMDTWGYTFRLGSAGAWYRHDAEDARAWLVRHGLFTEAGEPTFRLRAA
jgi:hypothetical protein